MINYKDAGVDIEAGNEAVDRIKSHVQATYTPAIKTNLGSFAAVIDLPEVVKGYKHPQLVQSIDGLGTKISVAVKAQYFENVGEDLLSATSNDILVYGAKPVTLLDYIAADKIKPEFIERIVAGLANACKKHGVALVGGETAEMPGTYKSGEYDVAGIITGVVEKDKIIDGSKIKAGDKIFGFASSGLHTNGYSLARKLLFEVAGFGIDSHVDELQMTVAEALLKPHINYQLPILEAIDNGLPINGMVHITGGGFTENIPRVLPEGLNFTIKENSWPELPIFNLLQSLGKIDRAEMMRTFNMGIGFVVIGPDSLGKDLQQLLAKHNSFQCFGIGEISSV